MPNLYKLAEEYRELAEQLEQMDGLNSAAIVDTLDGSTELMSIEQKVSGIIQMVKNWQGDIPAYEAEIERLTTEKKAIENRIDSVKQYLKLCLETAKLDKVKIGVFTARFQKNSRGSVIIEDEKQVPAAYIDIIPEQKVTNKERLYETLKTGQVIPGAKYEVGRHLRIS